MSFKSFTSCRILPASSIIYKQQTKKSGGVSFQDKKPIGLQMFKGQVPIGNGCGPWTGHTNSTNISWHLTPSSLPLFISSHLIAFHPHLISPPVTDHERVVPVFAGEQERWSGCVCLCVNRNMNVITPPHPSGNWSAKRFGVPVCAQEHERYYPTPPHR